MLAGDHHFALFMNRTMVPHLKKSKKQVQGSPVPMYYELGRRAPTAPCPNLGTSRVPTRAPARADNIHQ